MNILYTVYGLIYDRFKSFILVRPKKALKLAWFYGEGLFLLVNSRNGKKENIYFSLSIGDEKTLSPYIDRSWLSS